MKLATPPGNFNTDKGRVSRVAVKLKTSSSFLSRYRRRRSFLSATRLPGARASHYATPRSHKGPRRARNLSGCSSSEQDRRRRRLPFQVPFDTERPCSRRSGIYLQALIICASERTRVVELPKKIFFTAQNGEGSVLVGHVCGGQIIYANGVT